ncbi:MAG TPA: SPFH domain-containing protein [Bdellovibrionales bacterium]|nr:SPFH domain-containing protein [Bdellovibrionales bacterium]
MGLFDLFKKQFIDVIDWTESGDGVLAYRYPVADREIQNGAQLTVRESQYALFVNEGEIADLFGPGRYTLNTKTLPVMTSLKNWDKAFASPFKSDVYFFSAREQIDQRWGTATPVTIRDKDFGPIRIRAHGTFSYKVKNPQVFYKKLSGTRELYTTEDVNGQLRSAILTNFATLFGSPSVAFIDMASNQMKFSETIAEAMQKSFADYGLQLTSFLVQSISLPDTLQEKFDKMAGMRMVGDLQRYAQFQAADSIAAAAANEGGAAGAGAGLGAGMAIGQTMANAFGSGGGAGRSDEDPVVMIDKLHELLKKGVLTQAEFDSKKAELLSRIK